VPSEAEIRPNDQRDTAATMTTARVPIEEEITATWSSLTAETAGLRDNARFLHDGASALHQETQRHDLDARTFAKARASAQDLLTELANRGYSWTTIARLVGVSVPALRKWRMGENPSGENRRRLGQLAALTDFLEEYMINDVPSWLEMPLDDTVPTTCADICAAGRVDLVLDFAANRINHPHDLLDAFNSQWRSDASPYEVVTAPDGIPSIRRR
jgi:hypothetical protein